MERGTCRAAEPFLVGGEVERDEHEQRVRAERSRGHDNRARALESIGVHWQHYVANGAARSIMRQVSALRVEDTLALADRLPSLGLAARVVWGEADQFQKVQYGRRLAAALGTTLHPIPGGKHFTPEDQPEAVAAAVNELLPR